MKTLDQFILDYDGKQVEVAGSAGAEYQCVDLVNAYIREVLGFPIIEWTDAKDFPAHIGNYYDFVKNTIDNVPSKGDIVVWTGSVGFGHGHVAVCISSNTNDFASFDENWSTPLRCKIEGHTYQYVNGWMHPKGVTMDCLLSNTDADRKTFEGLVSKSSKMDDVVKAGFNTVADINALVADLRKSIDDKQGEINAAKALAENYRTELRDFIADLADEETLNCRQDKNEIISICDNYGDKLGQLEDLQTAFAALKNTSETEESELKAEVARLQALLANQNVLDNVKTSDLIKEIVKRLVHIMDRG